MYKIVFFRFLRWPPSAILDLKIFKFLVANRVETTNVHRYIFCQNWPNGSGDIVSCSGMFLSYGRIFNYRCTAHLLLRWMKEVLVKWKAEIVPVFYFQCSIIV